MADRQESYTVPQLAERWQCDRATVIKMIHRAELHAINLSASPHRANWRVMGESVRRFEETRANQEPPRRRSRKQVASNSGTWY